MLVQVYKDETIALDLDQTVGYLNRLSKECRFTVGKARFSITESVVSCRETYDMLDSRIDKESASADLVVLFTEKPYDNNYFFEYWGNKCIVSMSDWDALTDLPRNNGAVYFICALVVRTLRVGSTHRRKNTGCVNDFWNDKRGIDTGMRAGHICTRCVQAFDSNTSKESAVVLDDVQTVLESLGTVSRENRDVCQEEGPEARSFAFDVFMCHNDADKPAVRRVDQRLREAKIVTWLDEDQLPPGTPWQIRLEEQIQSIRTAAIFVGYSGLGPWQRQEMYALLSETVERKCPVIPVILRECQSVPMLPLFLKQLTWVDFRKEEPDPFKRLLWGITGERPSI